MNTRAALPFRVLVITDEAACRTRARGVIETVARAFAHPAPDVALLVRAKSRDIDDVRALCSALRPITTRAGARLLVHTHVSLVRELNLDGAHVDAQANVNIARAALPTGALLGASRHDRDALDAAALDYVTLSPIFAPASKPTDERAPLGVRVLSVQTALRSALQNAPPIVALGGIDDSRARACFRAGARAVAVIGAVMSAQDPGRALQTLRNAAP